MFLPNIESYHFLKNLSFILLIMISVTSRIVEGSNHGLENLDSVYSVGGMAWRHSLTFLCLLSQNVKTFDHFFS